jgi:hypothetical protein
MDPLEIIATIQALAGAAKAGCDVLLTPEGQLMMKTWREDGQAFRDGVKAIGSWAGGIIKDLGGKTPPPVTP